ncbi:MAG: tetratricopeptide repeat protein, partial [Candidatus Poribacteria bacterium]|nr:tetratricopeptide repeat protein [Candidatus Poribacteria bacterium]
GKYDDSIEHANSFLDQFPESELAATALMISAELNYKLKRNYEQSLLKFQKTLEQFPKNDYVGHAAVGVILSLRKLNRDDEVQNQFKLLNEQFSKNEWIAVLKSYAEGLKQTSYSLHDIALWEQVQAQKRARDAFKEVLESELTFLDLKGDVRYNIAQSYLDEKKYPQAFIEFDTIVTEEFSSWPKLQEKAMYQAAYCLKQQGIYDESLSRYLEFINRFPDSEYVTDVYFDRGKVYAEKSNKDYDLARFNYDLALKWTVDSSRRAEIHFAFARTYYDEGVYKNAILEYDKWLSSEEYPGSVSTIEAKHFIANSHYLQGDLEKNWEKTVKAYQRVIDEHGETEERVSWRIHGSPEVPNRIALCSYRIADIHYELGTKHAQENLAIEHWKQALSRYEKIIDEYPTDDVAPYALYGGLLVRMKLESIQKKNNEIRAVALTQKAEEYIDKLREANADEILLAEAQLNFAHIKRGELQDYKGAAAEYKKLWDNQTPRPDLTFNLIKLQGKYYEGVCYEKDLKSDSSVKSIEAYQEAIMLFKAIFQPLIDTPNIEVPYRDHHISTALRYAGLANYELGETISEAKPGDEAMPYFEEALRVFESLVADYPKNPLRMPKIR